MTGVTRAGRGIYAFWKPVNRYLAILKPVFGQSTPSHGAVRYQPVNVSTILWANDGQRLPATLLAVCNSANRQVSWRCEGGVAHQLIATLGCKPTAYAGIGIHQQAQCEQSYWLHDTKVFEDKMIAIRNALSLLQFEGFKVCSTIGIGLYSGHLLLLFWAT